MQPYRGNRPSIRNRSGMSNTPFLKTEVISASFTFAYDADTKEFTYSMTIGGKAFGDITRTELNDLVGLRYLWNARLNKDGVELSNLTLA